jgi:adenylate cyclase
MAKITYHHECTVEEEDLSLSLLDVSLKHGIPHTHVCGGKARCSTCRVLVVDNPDHLRPRTDAERVLATRKGFDDSIRLACQAGLCGDVTIRRLVVDETDTELTINETPMAMGREAQVAVLFSDVRNFTVFSEGNLPYDVIHVLNRYFQPVGEAVLRHRGYIDKYMGDGLMAIFGLEGGDARDVCLDAVRAALEMRATLDDVNAYLANLTDTRFAAGIGIHFGTAVVGEIGHPAKRQFTAIGDTVNTASRIESATKQFKTDLLISDCVLRQISDDVKVGQTFVAELKGKSGVFDLHEVVGLVDTTAG